MAWKVGSVAIRGSGACRWPGGPQFLVCCLGGGLRLGIGLCLFSGAALSRRCVGSSLRDFPQTPPRSLFPRLSYPI